MKKSFRSMMITVLALVLCLVMASSAALAEAAKVRTATIGATVVLKGYPPEEKEKYSIVMEADDAAYPMPEGSADGKYTLTMTGARSKDFPAISYDHVGKFTYKIYQLPGKNEYCKYDAAVYTLTVSITNDGEGGFDIMAVLNVPDEEHKPDEVEFINTYAPSGDDTPTGVNDSWPLFLACSVVLVGAGVLLFWWIRRRDDDDDLEFDEE